MKATFENLIKLENKARRSCYKAKNFIEWRETTGANYQNKWDKMITELRGWYDCTPHDQRTTKKEWLDYCKENNYVIEYNFGDVIC
jgi:hypothetical protein